MCVAGVSEFWAPAAGVSDVGPLAVMPADCRELVLASDMFPSKDMLLSKVTDGLKLSPKPSAKTHKAP